MIWDLLIAVVPAVILFLYGIENFSEEVRHAAGERFRTILQNATKTSLRGALAGAAVTVVVTVSVAVTAAPVGGVPDAVAVLTTEPASTSAWVSA